MATAQQQLPTSYRNQVAAADEIQAQLEAISAQQPVSRDPFADVLADTPPAPAPAPAEPPPPAPAPARPAQTAPQVLSSDELRSIIETNKRVTEFITERAPPPPSPAPRAPAPAPSIVPQAFEPQNDEATKNLFGDDVLNMVDAKISRAVQPLIEAFRRIEQRFQSVGSEVSSVAQRSALTAEQQMVQYLDTAVPNWKAINADKKWLGWLAEADPIYGRARQLALDEAVSAGDGVRTATIFKAYLSTLPPAPAPAPASNTIEAMATPVTVSGGSAPAAPPAGAATIFTSDQVQSFYNDLSRGKYRGREADAKKIADAIDVAAAAGRITR